MALLDKLRDLHKVYDRRVLGESTGTGTRYKKLERDEVLLAFDTREALQQVIFELERGHIFDHARLD